MNVLDAPHYFIQLSLLCICRAYVDLIDLTNEPPSEGESSDLDDLPLTVFHPHMTSMCIQEHMSRPEILAFAPSLGIIQ